MAQVYSRTGRFPHYHILIKGKCGRGSGGWGLSLVALFSHRTTVGGGTRMEPPISFAELRAAEEIVAHDGYQALSARKVAGAIGYTVGTLYLVFEHLDDLIMQVNGRTLDRLYQRIMEDQTHCGDPQASLLQLGHSYIRFADGEPHAWQMIFEHRLAGDREPPDWLREKVARMFALVEEHLAQLADHHPKRKIAQAARALWGGVHGICILAINDSLGAAGVDSVQAITHLLMSNFLKGFIETPPSSKEG